MRIYNECFQIKVLLEINAHEAYFMIFLIYFFYNELVFRLSKVDCMFLDKLNKRLLNSLPTTRLYVFFNFSLMYLNSSFKLSYFNFFQNICLF